MATHPDRDLRPGNLDRFNTLKPEERLFVLAGLVGFVLASCTPIFSRPTPAEETPPASSTPELTVTPEELFPSPATLPEALPTPVHLLSDDEISDFLDVAQNGQRAVLHEALITNVVNIGGEFFYAVLAIKEKGETRERALVENFDCPFRVIADELGEPSRIRSQDLGLDLPVPFVNVYTPEDLRLDEIVVTVSFGATPVFLTSESITHGEISGLVCEEDPFLAKLSRGVSSKIWEIVVGSQAGKEEALGTPTPTP